VGAPRLSIIVPVLDEQQLITAFLRHVREIAPDAELLVADGGSSDNTAALAAPLCDRLIRTTPGRAEQMNAGAAAAAGDVLWFVHADSMLPQNAVVELLHALRDEQLAGGCFSLAIARRELIYRVSDSLGNIGVRLFGITLGDHGIFCRRSAFEAAGGFPLLPILEDAEFYRRLRRVGKVRQLEPQITTSARTFERVGRYRTTFVYFLILALYVLRVPVPLLHRIYLRLHARRS
jgi:rSAM/selenodomain-associated transferase 2